MKGALVSHPSGGAVRANEKRRRELQEQSMAKEFGRTHKFTIFRIGMDACAKCRRPRSEHK